MVVFLLGDAVIRGGLADAALLAPWPLLALWLVYVSAFASSITVDGAGVIVQNMLQIIRIPWPRVRDMQWRWQVELTLDDGRQVRAQGGPLQGRGGRRPGSPSLTPGHVRAQFDYLTRLREAAADRLRTGEVPPVRRGWDPVGLIALAILVVWAIAAIAVTGGL
ncbi:hypothetical protein GCM10022240_12570 [Microbacterium kribbense]|uniref:PH domain-containing protein n=1 Tax=Microbacterium kribbense TaxID=433645 RepID=A0ABP7GCJ7_9MICO